MNKKKIHFFHGFLGQGSDWDEVIQAFDDQEIEFVKHNLWVDLKNLSQVSFQAWADYKTKQLQSSSPQVFVGYSLGGRLLMHLNPELFEKVVLVASHPGLIREEDRELRKTNDEKWVNRIHEMPWKALLDLWNSQDVFANDKSRPSRDEDNFDRELVAQALEGFSLSRQRIQDESLLRSKEKTYWLIGEKDKRYSLLKDRMTSLLGEAHVLQVDGAGHGCLFDQPEKLAKIIEGIL